MLLVDQGRKGCLRCVIPFARRRFAARVLRRRDNLKILVLEFRVDFLPTWQIEAASSPGGPGDHQHFLPAETGEAHDLAAPVGHREIGGDA